MSIQKFDNQTPLVRKAGFIPSESREPEKPVPFGKLFTLCWIIGKNKNVFHTGERIIYLKCTLSLSVGVTRSGSRPLSLPNTTHVTTLSLPIVQRYKVKVIKFLELIYWCLITNWETPNSQTESGHSLRTAMLCRGQVYEILAFIIHLQSIS